jgi:hypothetical protein
LFGRKACVAIRGLFLNSTRLFIPSPLQGERVRVRGSTNPIALRAGFYFGAVPEPRSGSFLLRGQKKRTKEKATRRLAPSALLMGFPALLARAGARKGAKYASIARSIRLGLRCSAAPNGRVARFDGCAFMFDLEIVFLFNANGVGLRWVGFVPV